MDLVFLQNYNTVLNSEVSYCYFTCSEVTLLNIQMVLHTVQVRKILNASLANTHSSNEGIPFPYYPKN